MKFSQLAISLSELETTQSRIKIAQILSSILVKSDKSEIEPATNLLLGQLAPGFKGVVFNIAERMMIRAIAQATGEKEEKVRANYKDTGDLGQVTERLTKKKKSNTSIREVYGKLYKIAIAEGEGSQEKKIKLLSELLSKSDPLSTRFVVRMVLGKLRLGFSDKTVVDALSIMTVGDKSARGAIERAYEVTPDVGKLAAKIKVGGISAVGKAKPQVGIPVLPMLPQRLKSAREMIEKMRKVAVEPKFDGLRVQIHFARSKGFISAYSRNLNEVSSMFPELAKIGRHTEASELILDTEAIGFDKKTKKFLDFQMTMTRRRKHGISKAALDTPVRFQLFDILMKDGKSLMQEPYIKRREILESAFVKNPVFLIDESTLTSDPAVIVKRHKKYLNSGFEGVIVKKTDSKYVPGRTGWRWVKMKEREESRGKIADTIDAVIMGYTRGRGKRAGFGIGQFLAGVTAGGKLVTITKVGTGLTDEQFQKLAGRLKKSTVGKKPKEYLVHKDLAPDFWVEPQQVVELAADEITKSPKHTAGLALRFPRLIKFRDDKGSGEATTLSEIRRLYKLQN